MHHADKRNLIDKLSLVGVRVLFAASLLLGLVLVVFGGYSIYEQLYTQNRAFATSGINTKEVYTVEAQEKLALESKNYRATLTIENTNINYAVMQGDDDLYYANHDTDGNMSLTGAIYMAAGNKSDLSDDYIVIYGHHMDRSALENKAGMFGDLEKFLDKDFFDTNPSGQFGTPSGIYNLELWAVVITDAYENDVYAAGTQTFDKVVEYVNKYSKYIRPEALTDAKKIIALSTCLDATTNGRLVVFYTLKEETVVPPNPTNPTTPTHPTNPSTPANEDTGITTPTGKIPTGTETTTPDDDKPVTPDNPPKPDNPDKPDTPVDDKPVTPDDDKPEPASWWEPSGSSYGLKAWALVNLICLIIIVYTLVPIFCLRKKYGRIHKMRKVNKAKEELFEAQDMSPEDWTERERIMTVATKKSENGYVSKDSFCKAVEELFFKVKAFTRKFVAGIILEVIFAIAGVIVFILTEDMRLPMVIIDKWTPVMLLLLVGSVIAEFTLTRYKRSKKDKKENEENGISLSE